MPDRSPSLRLLRPAWVALCLLAATLASAAPDWVGSWATAPIAEPATKENLALEGATLRQVVRVSLAGDSVRVRVSNAFGATALDLHGASLAPADAAGAVRPASLHPLLFSGRPAASVPPGACLVSDPVPLAVASGDDLAISLHFARVPAILTAHPGSRTTSYLAAGDALSALTLPAATTFARWYFINGLDVTPRDPAAAALVLLGDSITDGYGVKPGTNQRWPDEFVRRLRGRTDLVPLGVLNLGIGGNRLLRDGLGPNALARFDRDVLGQSGARWLLVFSGINDIGTRLDARKQGTDYASAADIIAAYEQLFTRARARGLRVIAATLTPYRGADFYWSEDGEADRQAINAWIRTSGRADAVADFDAALRDPAAPDRLAAEFDSGDHLHPSMAGYKRLAEALDLSLFTR